MHATFPTMPIWLTEFACHNFVSALSTVSVSEIRTYSACLKQQDGGEQCTYADAVAFMNTTQSWLDQQDYIHRYAWFGAMKNPVINPVRCLLLISVLQSLIALTTGQRAHGSLGCHQRPWQAIHRRDCGTYQPDSAGPIAKLRRCRQSQR